MLTKKIKYQLIFLICSFFYEKGVIFQVILSFLIHFKCHFISLILDILNFKIYLKIKWSNKAI